MKILVLQTARLGDILMSWPALRALRRARAGAEIHLLVRPRFRTATKGLNVVDRVVVLPSEDLLEPLTRPEPDDAESLRRTEDFLSGLRAENYDEVINLSFSPLSSWIVKSVASSGAVVRGYGRHTDGWLHIADGVSSYFYAQVGPGRFNRIHLTDLFAALMEIDLEAVDWSAPQLEACDFGLPEKYVALHAGASESGKMVQPFLWGRIVKRFTSLHPEAAVVVIGSEHEAPLANEIRANAGGATLIDLTGKTRFEELFHVVGRAAVLVGADSAPMHVASLTQTPCLNVSLGDVCFWETGPKAVGSAVMRAESASDLSSERVAQALSDLYEGRDPRNTIRSQTGIPSFRESDVPGDDFGWNLLRAIYLGEAFPVTEDPRFVDAVSRLREMNDVVLEQLDLLAADAPVLATLVDRADDVFQALARAIPECGILARWVLTEKTRIPPGSKEEIRDGIRGVHLQLAQVLRLYDIDAHEGKGTGHGKV